MNGWNLGSAGSGGLPRLLGIGIEELSLKTSPAFIICNGVFSDVLSVHIVVWGKTGIWIAGSPQSSMWFFRILDVN